MTPLQGWISDLAKRARIELRQVAPPRTASVTRPYGLTDRELEVLTHLTHGHSNAQIGHALFISEKTASVHITHILRKLGVTNRLQAAILAERAGLADDMGARG